MTYQECVKIIGTKYPLIKKSNNVGEIRIDKMLDETNYYYVNLINEDGKMLLTDFAETCRTNSFFYNIPELEYKLICSKHNIQFNDWHIECKFESLKDLDNFVEVLDELSKKYKER